MNIFVVVVNSKNLNTINNKNGIHNWIIRHENISDRFCAFQTFSVPIICDYFLFGTEKYFKPQSVRNAAVSIHKMPLQMLPDIGVHEMMPNTGCDVSMLHCRFYFKGKLLCKWCIHGMWLMRKYGKLLNIFHTTKYVLCYTENRKQHLTLNISYTVLLVASNISEQKYIAIEQLTENEETEKECNWEESMKNILYINIKRSKREGEREREKYGKKNTNQPMNVAAPRIYCTPINKLSNDGKINIESITSNWIKCEQNLSRLKAIEWSKREKKNIKWK